MKNIDDKESFETSFRCPFQVVDAKVRSEPRDDIYLCAMRQGDRAPLNQEQSEDHHEHLCLQCPDISRNRYTRNPVKDCEYMQRLVQAFENREYEIIHSYFKQIVDYPDWQKFVINTTGIEWNRWKMHIGTWLLRECRSDPKSPFKALLPESNHDL